MTLPNGPKTPWMLRVLKLIFHPLEYMEDYARRYGDIFKVGGEKSPPFVYVSNPQVIKEIFAADPELFESGRGNAILRYFLGDNSLVLLDGASHQRQRRLLMPPFHGDCLRDYSQLICDITKEVTDRWTAGTPFTIRLFMQEITLRVILRAVFGLDEGERFQQLRHLLSKLMDMFNSPISSTLLFFPSLRQDWGSMSPWGIFLRLRDRVKQVITDITQLPYLTAICQETLRIYPVAPSTFLRILKAPMELMGYQFETGTSILLSIYLVHHRGDLYPEPKLFKPERFLERQYSAYEYLPFGGGNRRCLGSGLALLEMKLVLATIVSRFQMKLTNNRSVKPIRRGLTIAPPPNLQMVLIAQK